MSTQEKYPLYKRIFVNGEWIGSDLFKEHFDLDNTSIIISDILGMTDYLAVNVNTPSTTELFALNFESVYWDVYEWAAQYRPKAIRLIN